MPGLPSEDLDRRVGGHHPRPGGDDRLHLGHHRPAQGLRAHPRQPHLRGAQVAVGRRRALHEGDSTLMFLPLAHVLARVVQFACVTAACRSATPPASATSPRSCRCSRRRGSSAVPRVFEKIFNGAAEPGRRRHEGQDLRRAAAVADRVVAASEQAGKVSSSRRLQHRLFDKLVYSKLRAAMGGELRWAISGGAPLGERLGHFFNGLGLHGARGLRPHRDHRGGHGQHPGPPPIGTVGRPGARRDRSASPTTARCCIQGRHRVQRLLAATTRPPRTASGRRVVRTPATSAKLDDDGFLRSPAARRTSSSPPAARTCSPPSWRTASRPTRSSARRWSSATARPFIAALVTLDPEELPAWAPSTARPARTARRAAR